MNERRISTKENPSGEFVRFSDLHIIAKRLRILQIILILAIGAAFAQTVSGFFSAALGGNAACPDWPLCFGRFSFPEQPAAAIQYAHHLLAVLTAGLLISAWSLGRLWFQSASALISQLAFTGGLLVAQSGVGAIEVLTVRTAQLGPLHLALALGVLTGLLLATASAFNTQGMAGKSISLRWETPFSRMALVMLFATLVLMTSAVWLAGNGSPTACSGWPLCDGSLPASSAGWLQFGHRLFSAAVGGLVIAFFIQAWKDQYRRPFSLTAASAVLVIFIGQGLIGAAQVKNGFPADLMMLHALNSTALFVVQALVVVHSAGGFQDAEEISDGQDEDIAGRDDLRKRSLDFFLLSKPLIVVLLLFTTFTGMVAAGHSFPGWQLIFWTMLGGGLSAAGASAINQYIDRELDRFMVRTARRPLPDRRLTAAEGLAFGVIACLAGFYLLATFVNMLAALLSLVGMIYYVGVYSMWLKTRTVQNIVIGGGAGAVPILVGWAAVTGRLDWQAIGLFLIVFLWTPPHFWALALVRRKDYARVGIPMLPVVFGERFTRRQIFFYTLVLVGFSMLLPLMDLGGAVYWLTAMISGGVLVYLSVRVLTGKGNKDSWMLYRYSSMYLAILFLGLILDTLLGIT